jgi:hypothetical protein
MADGTLVNAFATCRDGVTEFVRKRNVQIGTMVAVGMVALGVEGQCRFPVTRTLLGLIVGLAYALFQLLAIPIGLSAESWPSTLWTILVFALLIAVVTVPILLGLGHVSSFAIVVEKCCSHTRKPPHAMTL